MQQLVIDLGNTMHDACTHVQQYTFFFHFVIFDDETLV